MQSSSDGLMSSSSTAATISQGRPCIDKDGTAVPVMPLRLIDVDATILNRERGGIFFTRQRNWHVISHTWSADVRELSKIVGRRLKDALLDDREDNGGRSYEQLFKEANFSDASSYQSFVDFLIILRADEVKWVWFDAVCINQTDLQEKDAEIQQMGTYYERSLGSYVVHHGIGQGFELLDRNTQGDIGQQFLLPRWFSRAWTFQEWVLPQKTTFIIDIVSEQNLRKTATTALLTSDSQLCLCCDYEVTFHPPFLWQCMHSTHEKAAGDENEYDLSTSSSAKVRQCLYNTVAQLDHFRRIPDRKHWYFTDDLGYVFLVRVKVQMKNAILWAGGGSIFQRQRAMSDPEFQLTDRLGVKMSLRGMSAYEMTRERKMPLVIEEVSIRDCSNAEDRVLSILKLLDVEGAIQVRSGKSLKEQIIHVAKSLLEKGEDQHNEMLLRLCLADGFGNQTRGMSWAPHFEVKKGSWQEGGRQLAQRFIEGYYLGTFEPCARVQEVSTAGELRLVSEAVCAGQLICNDHSLPVEKHRSRADELVKPMALQVSGQNVAHLCARFSAQLAPNACVLEHVGNNSAYHAMSCIVIRAPRICNWLDHLPFRKTQIHNPLDYLQERIPVWLVKIGVGLRGISPRVVTYFLVCIGENLHGALHKIGYVGIPLDIVSNSQFSGLLEKRETMCLLGGLGRHSTKHLFNKGTCFFCDCFDCFLSGYNYS